MPVPLSILSYNIHKGFKPGNQTFVLAAIKKAIEAVGADLVFLQEILGDHSKVEIANWPNNSQFEYLADKIWPHFAYGKNAVYSKGHHGNAILSKYPIKCSENIDVSVKPYSSRGILHAEIDIRGKPLHALCIHFDLFKTDRNGQVSQLCDRIEASVPSSEPFIIGGDFNDWTVAASKQLKSKLHIEEVFKTLTGKHARTFPAQLPALMLDRIYFRGLELNYATRMTGKPWSVLSDHLPLSAHFEFGIFSK